MGDADRRIGLALSGGGWRAAAYHLGVLQRLEELGVLGDLAALSCVSGGAVVGALFALRRNERGPAGYPVTALIAELRPVLEDNLRSAALFGTPVRALRTAASMLRWGPSRAQLLADELDRRLFHGQTLAALPDWIVISATNLRTGKAWKFYHDVAGDFLTGATKRTDQIRLADVVAASAAFPGLCDPLRLHLDWAELTADNIDRRRWQLGARTDIGERSPWRKRFGQAAGPVAIPLVDGGLYDNDGFAGLRGWQASHAIFSGASPAEGDLTKSGHWAEAMRMIDVMHERLGGGTRQLSYAVTHGMSPAEVTATANRVAIALKRLEGDEILPVATRAECRQLREMAEDMARANVPTQDTVFTGIAHTLLHRTDLAQGSLKPTDGKPFSVPESFRGLPVDLVEELSRVRTDLDAMSPGVVDLLIAQGYFFVDAVLKQGMRDVIPGTGGSGALYGDALAPTWPVARGIVAGARDNIEGTKRRIVGEQKRVLPFGRSRRKRETVGYWVNIALVGLPILGAIGVALWAAWSKAVP